MTNLKVLNIIKYKLVRLIEGNPTLNLFIYNNIKFLKFFLPHEKDYLGMKKLCQNSLDKVIIDIGANLGIHQWDLDKWVLKIKYIYLNQIQ
mgnify:CR=1 FL=1